MLSEKRTVLFGVTFRGASKVILLVAVAALLFLPVIALAVGFAIMPRGATWNPVKADTTSGSGSVIAGPDCKAYSDVKLTAYWPATKAVHDAYDKNKGIQPIGKTHSLNGGLQDRKGRLIHTLEQYLAGEYADQTTYPEGNYVSLAVDFSDTSPFHDLDKVTITSIEAGLLKPPAMIGSPTPIVFRISDTGSAFTGQGSGKADVAVNTINHAGLSFLNERTTIYVGEKCPRAGSNP